MCMLSCNPALSGFWSAAGMGTNKKGPLRTRLDRIGFIHFHRETFPLDDEGSYAVKWSLLHNNYGRFQLDQFRYIKINVLSCKGWGNKTGEIILRLSNGFFLLFYSPESRSHV